MNAGGVLIATALSAFIASVCMAFFANLPFALAPGMGLNAYFAFVVVGQMGFSWQMALFAVFIEGLIFIALSLTNVRQAIFNAIPMSLKHAVGAGIGLFIAFIGLQNAGAIVNNDATLVAIAPFKTNPSQANIAVILAILGVIFIALLAHRRVKGAILFGILGTWVLGMILQAVGIYRVDVERGFYSLYPSWGMPDFGGFGSLFGQAFRIDFSNIRLLDYLVVIFAFLFVDIFDTIGTLIGVAGKADMLDEKGQLPNVKGALLADAVGTTAGAVFGTSTVTTYVESSAGVAEGGRTGLTALSTGVLFLVAIVLSPVFISIPAFATAPALVYVGFLMLTAILKIKFDDLTDAIPAYLCLLVMPLAYSISEGIAVGILSFVVLNLLGGKWRKISPLMYVLALLFILKYIFI